MKKIYNIAFLLIFAFFAISCDDNDTTDNGADDGNGNGNGNSGDTERVTFSFTGDFTGDFEDALIVAQEPTDNVFAYTANQSLSSNTNVFSIQLVDAMEGSSDVYQEDRNTLAFEYEGWNMLLEQGGTLNITEISDTYFKANGTGLVFTGRNIQDVLNGNLEGETKTVTINDLDIVIERPE
ncbi:MAG: hypothetical protein Kapaf2KO_12740 [Candidatus Kapaibacteriales bacterium]